MIQWLPQAQLDSFLHHLTTGRSLFALSADKDQLHLERATAWDPNRHVLDRYRPMEPLKALVFPPREMLGPVFQNAEQTPVQPRVVVGVKNCDLSALAIHDYVLLKNEPVDPFYAHLREQTLLVSCDCTDCRKACFCPIVGEQPYPKEGFDINFSPMDGGYIIESGSDRGQALLNSFQPALAAPSAEALKQRDQRRQAMYQRVADQAATGHGLKPGMDLRAGVVKSEEADLWKKFAEDCVECGACNYICCTCHCFLLRDGRSPAQVPERLKQWDSCLHKNFARVAGGANPRAHRVERLYNRFDKKFNFFPAVLGTYACDGCGRCAEACTGKIDIRDVLREAVQA